MARAIGLSAYGGPEVLTEIEVEVPEPEEGQVLVQVRSAGINPVDCKIRGGLFAGDGDAFPQRLGNEFAGTVVAVGPGVDAIKAGQDVLGFTVMEAYAEQIVVDASNVTTKPDVLGFAEAGSLSAVGQTAYNALKELELARGDTVLIHAAAGGVGTVAVQLAVRAGATVIGTAREDNHEYLRELGAIPVVYGDGLTDRVRALAPQGVDAALDLIGGKSIVDSVQLVADRDRIGTTVDAEAVDKYGIRRLRGARSKEVLAELAELAAKNELRLTVSKSLPLAQADEAHREVETGHVRGKVVLVVD